MYEPLLHYFYYHSSRLCDAKRSVLQQQDTSNPSIISAIQKAITSDELGKHCHRRTRGTEETMKAIEDLLLQFSPATDSVVVPIFS